MLQMHFPADYAGIDSPFEGLSALQYYVFLLTNLPQLAFASDAYPSFRAGGTVVSNVTVALPGKEPFDGATFQASASAAGSNDGSSSDTNSTLAPLLQVVDIDVGAISAATPGMAHTLPALDMSQVIDTEPPRLTLLGHVLVKVLQADAYEDAGAVASDNIDGNAVVVRHAIQLCNWQDWMLTAAADTNTSLTCGNTPVTNIQTGALLTSASGAQQVYVITYTAKDTAGNQAAPVRRYVTVIPR
jgi:hypothetical protein